MTTVDEAFGSRRTGRLVSRVLGASQLNSIGHGIYKSHRGAIIEGNYAGLIKATGRPNVIVVAPNKVVGVPTAV